MSDHQQQQQNAARDREGLWLALICAPAVVFVALLWADIIWFCITGHDFGGFRDF